MTTTIGSTPAPTLDDLRAAHRAAEIDKASAHVALAAAQERVRIVRSAQAENDDAPSLTRRDRLRNQIALVADEDALEDLELAALDADEREGAAREALRAAEAAEALIRRRQIVTRLAKHLLAARVEADALSELEQATPSGDALLWPALQSHTPTFEPQLDLWLGRVREYGLLES